MVLTEFNILLNPQLKERREQVLLPLFVDAEAGVDDLNREHLVEPLILLFLILSNLLLNRSNLLVGVRQVVQLHNEYDVAPIVIVLDTILNKIKQYQFKLSPIGVKVHLLTVKVLENMHIDLPIFYLKLKGLDDVLDIVLWLTGRRELVRELTLLYLHPLYLVVIEVFENAAGVLDAFQ